MDMGTELRLAGPGLDADVDEDAPPGTKDVGTGTEGAVELKSENVVEGEPAEGGGGEEVKEGETGEYACGSAVCATLGGSACMLALELALASESILISACTPIRLVPIVRYLYCARRGQPTYMRPTPG
jgi:hypothetical protein